MTQCCARRWLWLLLLVVTVVQHDLKRCRVCAETVPDRSRKLMCGVRSGVVAASCFITRIVLDVAFLLGAAYFLSFLNTERISAMLSTVVLCRCVRNANMYD